MDAVCEYQEDKEHDLKCCEGRVGSNYDGGSWAGCEYRGDEVRQEGCHSGWEATVSERAKEVLGLRKRCHRGLALRFIIILGYQQDSLPFALGGSENLLLEF